MLGDNIKNLRKKKGISRNELARITGFSARAIEHIENGQCDNPKVKTLQEISKVFNVTIDELIK